MESIIIIVHVLAALSITGLVLIQQGKGADIGASFGSGASQTIFGSAGTGNVLTKSTTWLAVIFFSTSLLLAYYARQQANSGVQDDTLVQNPDQVVNTAPANTGAPDQNQDVPTLDASAADGDLPQVPAGADSAQAAQDTTTAAADAATQAASDAAAPADDAGQAGAQQDQQ